MKSKFQKSTVKRRTDITRPFNGGEWTTARFNSFVKSALRGALWGPKFKCIEKAFVGYGINPATKRRCKMHKCADCRQENFTQKQMKADHIIPVVGPEGFVDWNTFIARLFVEQECYAAVCAPCHKKKTDAENAARRGYAGSNELD